MFSEVEIDAVTKAAVDCVTAIARAGGDFCVSDDFNLHPDAFGIAVATKVYKACFESVKDGVIDNFNAVQSVLDDTHAEITDMIKEARRENRKMH